MATRRRMSPTASTTSRARFRWPSAREIERGCPHDCGLCPDHQQHTCLGIIEVNSVCNMDCPLCFSTAGPGFSLTLEEVEAMLDDFVRTEGVPEVVQFSGGEPTIHPQIIDFVKAAKARGIRFVMINTNGKRIARDDKFVEQLAEVQPAFYFQFDGFERRTVTDAYGAKPTSSSSAFAPWIAWPPRGCASRWCRPSSAA